MSQFVRPPETLEITKVRPFGTELRAAIKAQFGTSRQFGIAISVTEGRVSQILSGAEIVSQHSLEQILKVFPDLETQECLHTAWISTFVTSPLEKLDELDLTTRSEMVLANLDMLIASGKAKQCVSMLATCRAQAQDMSLKFRLTHALINLNLYLDRSASALRLSKELAEEALRLGEASWIAVGLFTSANAGRISTTLDTKEVIRMHEELGRFVSDWNPKDLPTLTYKNELKGAIVRDRALTLLSMSNRKGILTEHLVEANQSMMRLVRDTDGLSSKVHALEVQARLLLALGNVFGSEEALEEVRTIQSVISVDHQAKAGILHGQILLARGEKGVALDLFNDLLMKCLETDAIHQASKIERILAST